MTLLVRFYVVQPSFHLLQALGGDLKGECRDFEAVPGHGLKCTVWGVEEYSVPAKWTYSSTIVRHPCVQSPLSLIPEQSKGASLPRIYQVCFTLWILAKH